MDTLLDILGMRREHNSVGEMEFIGKYLTPLNPTLKFDADGEVLAYVVDNSKGKSTIMWSCHIDTMHRNNTIEPERLTQEVWLDEQGIAFVTDKEDCLGADDGAGIWLMLEMIKADAAGTYVFHRGEEKGCWGSGQLAKSHTAWLETFTHAIAFDRKGTKSIITHQSGSRACSDALGNKLIELLGMEHALDTTGVYTDTAEYVDFIPECVNISSGYYSEHSHRETLDTNYILSMRDAMCAVDWLTADLPVVRDPAVQESPFGMYGSRWDSYYDESATVLIPDTIPHSAELIDCMPHTIKAWVRKSSTDSITYLIEDLVAEIAELRYTLDASYDVDDYDYDYNTRLKVGL